MLFWLCVPCLIVSTWTILIPLALSIVLGRIAFGFQKSGVSDAEAKRRAAMVAVLFFILLAVIIGLLMFSQGGLFEFFS